MSTSPSVLVTVPKYVTIKRVRPIDTNNSHTITNWCQVQSSSSEPSSLLTKVGKTYGGVVMQEQSTTINIIDDDMDNLETQPKKKRRLDHLTWEEKIQRK